jgi:hypothetical protein
VIDGLPRRKRFLPEDAQALDVLPSQVLDYATAAWSQEDGAWAEFAHEALLEELARGES